jgi:hypothetical protein
MRRVVLIVVVVVLCVVFFGGIAIGLSHSSDKTTHQSWTDTLGNVLVQPAQPSDLSPSAASCLQGSLLVAMAGSPCSYGLKAGFLGHKVTLNVVSAGPLGTQVTMNQPNILTESKTLVTGQEASFNYQKDRSTLTVQCLGFAGTCQLKLG